MTWILDQCHWQRLGGWLVFTWTVWFIGTPLAESAPPKPKGGAKPNIVFLFADDLGFGDLACYGHPYAKTPHLDRLAQEGTRFEQFYVTGVTCNPSRTGFMTGKFPATFAKYPADHGFGDRTTITELLHRNGYATGHFGKWHIGPERKPGVYGIDDVGQGESENPRRAKRDAIHSRDAAVYDQAIAFIEKNRNQPFYVNVWGHITHFPVMPPPAIVELFPPLQVDLTKFDPYMQEKLTRCQQAGGEINECLRNYLAEVQALDQEVGRLLKKLDELGLGDNTIVVFSSDHGPATIRDLEELSEKDKKREKRSKREPNVRQQAGLNMLGCTNGLRGSKHTDYEGGVRSPFILRWPGHVPAGRVDDRSVISGIDWLPTLCRITGTDTAQLDLDGEVVAAAWLGQPFTRTKPLFWKTSAPNSNASLRVGNWKFHGSQRKRTTVELYDLSKDPGERHNLADAHPEVVRDLNARLQAWVETLPKSYEKGSERDDEE